ncbi:MAG: hypothetical protein RBU37_16935 [Myxococcota bacterium]|jgi:hypothetical protein|nr:hypothetical protein [Myxococcota bacterium]
MEHVNLEDIKARRDATQQRIVREAAELADVVARDIPAFVQRELRRVFVEALDFSESLTDEQLVSIKNRIQSFSKELAETVKKELENGELWLDPKIEIKVGKTLEQHAPAWAVLQTIAQKTKALAVELGFPNTADLELVYKTPTWFMEGRYAPGMIEKYWNQLGLLREIEAELLAYETEMRRDALAQRWDAKG